MQVTKGTWCMDEQCVSSPAQEPGNEASTYILIILEIEGKLQNFFLFFTVW